jgi:hypothetical protein
MNGHDFQYCLLILNLQEVAMDAIKKDPDIKFLTGTFLDRPQPSINSYTRVITVSFVNKLSCLQFLTLIFCTGFFAKRVYCRSASCETGT